MMRTIARALSQAGMEVHVATTDDNGPERLKVPLGLPQDEEGATFWYFPRQTSFYNFSWPLTRWLAQNVKEFDLVHIHALFSYAALPAAVLARRAGVPYIVRPLGTLNRWGMQNRRRWLKRLSFRLIESRIMAGAAGIHYTCEQEQVEASELGVSCNSLIIPNAVDLPDGEVRPLRAPSSRKVILFLSRFDRKKGLDLLFEAFAQVRNKGLNAVLVLAGDGDPTLVAQLKRDAERLDIASDVTWAGFLTGDDKWKALGDADVFVLPSYSENFGVALVEALAFGLPRGYFRSSRHSLRDLSRRSRPSHIVQGGRSGQSIACSAHGPSTAGPHERERRAPRQTTILTGRRQPKTGPDVRGCNRMTTLNKIRLPITVVVLTYNEESNLGDCLSSVYRWADRIFVVDSGSTDRTREIAAHFDVELVQHPFETHARQWDWALERLPFQTEWVLGLDADQRVTPDLAREICGLDTDALNGVDGIYIKRRQIFRDKWIKHGGYYPKYLLKMFRRGSVKTDARDLVDHHFYVTGKTIKLRRDLLEVNKKEDDISFWIEKHNRYAALLAKEEMENKRTLRAHILAPSFLGKPDQQSLMLKKSGRECRCILRPFLYFLYRYFLRLGFLDGKAGSDLSFPACLLVPAASGHQVGRVTKPRDTWMNILGLNAFHGDASAALLSDGHLVAAIEEERLNRIKHWAGFPNLAAAACLEGTDPNDVEHVAISRNPFAHLGRKALYAALRPASWPRSVSRAANVFQVARLSAERPGTILSELKRARIYKVEHHRAHLASAFFASPFEEAAVVSVDGFGDYSSIQWGIGRGNRINVLGSVLFPHSLGILYTAFTQFLGFPKYGDEYKMMGLAAYGKPRFAPQVRRIVTN